MPAAPGSPSTRAPCQLAGLATDRFLVSIRRCRPRHVPAPAPRARAGRGAKRLQRRAPPMRPRPRSRPSRRWRHGSMPPRRQPRGPRSHWRHWRACTPPRRCLPTIRWRACLARLSVLLPVAGARGALPAGNAGAPRRSAAIARHGAALRSAAGTAAGGRAGCAAMPRCAGCRPLPSSMRCCAARAGVRIDGRTDADLLAGRCAAPTAASDFRPELRVISGRR